MVAAQSPSIFFEPTEQQASQLVSDLCSARSSLFDLAARYSTTVEALSLWMNSPEIQQRLANLEDSASGQIRLASTFQLNSAITALSKLIDEFNSTPPLFKKQPEGEAPTPRPTDEQVKHHLRTSDLVLKACTSLYRLSRFTALPRHRPRPAFTAHTSRAAGLAHPAGMRHPSPTDPRSTSRAPINAALTGDAEIDALILELQSVAHERVRPGTPEAHDAATPPDPDFRSAPNESESDLPCASENQHLRSEVSDPKSSRSAPNASLSQHLTSNTPHQSSPTSTAWP